MKKLLLIAALAAMAFGASAEGYTLTKVWQRTDVANLFISGVRQGVGMNGKFYINDTEWTSGGGTGEPVFYVYGETGEPTVLEGFGNTAVTVDEAGHIIVSTAAFPANIAGSTIKVLDPSTLEVLAEYAIPEECGLSGRCDFFGVPKGDMTQDGVMYLTGGNTNTEPFTPGVAILAVSGGEIDFDNSFLAPVDGGITGITSTVINYYKDLNGNDALIYAYRSGAPSKLVLDGDVFTKTAIALPGKGYSNGCFPLVWDGKELFIYPYKGTDATNYLDGWAIAEAGAEEPLIAVPSTVAAAANGYQNNWLNAVVDDGGVTIYQYYPGGYIAVWRLTKEVEIPNVYMLGGDDQGWDPTSGTLFDYDAENNVYTATITFPAEFNYFGFTTALAENNDDGGWAYIEPFRFGAIADEGTDYWYTGEEDFISLTWDDYHAIRIPGGEYNLTVNLADMKLVIEKVQPDFLRGDVDGDGNVNIADVTSLIDLLLNGAEMVPAADCDLDGGMNIADVTTLIDYLLSGTWPE